MTEALDETKKIKEGQLYFSVTKLVYVHFFKPSGKWYSSEAINWPYNDEELDAFTAVENIVMKDLHFRKYIEDGYMAVCIESPHKNSFPVMIKKD